MSKEKTLFKNTAIVTVGKMLTQLISFLLLPLYTAYLSTSEYGTVDLVNTLTSLILPFLTFQIDQGIFRYLIDVRNNEEKISKFISTSIIFLVFQSVIYTFIFMVGATFIKNEYKYFLLVFLIVNSFSNVLLQVTRGIGDNVRYTVGSFIYAVVGIILNVILIAGFKMGAYGMLIATIAGNIICIVYIIIAKKLYKVISIKKYNKESLQELLKYSFPLVPNAISWWIVNASDRVIISILINIEANGIYSVANKFSSVITTIFNIFSITWTESASINYNEEDRDEFFNKIYDIIFRLFGSICLLVISFMPFVFSILIDSKYNEAYLQIPILMIATFFNILVVFLGSIYVAKKLTKEIAKTSVMAAVINIVTNLLMIKFIDLYAASISTLLAWFSMYIYRSIDSKKYVNLKLNKNLICSLIIVVAVSVVTYYIHNIIICAIVAALTLIYAIIINKKIYGFVLNTLKEKLY